MCRDVGMGLMGTMGSTGRMSYHLHIVLRIIIVIIISTPTHSSTATSGSSSSSVVVLVGGRGVVVEGSSALIGKDHAAE